MLADTLVLRMKKHGIVVDRYVGKGAFGNVYACRKSFGSLKKYAAKVVDCGDDNKIKWQTENEIEILKEVCGHHQNIVEFHGVVRDKCAIAMILEYIPGSSFLEGILNWPRFNENDLKTITRQLLGALRYCHGKRIIHRDVCPENLLWYDVPTPKRPNTTPILKLIDFNLSRKIPLHSDHIRADALGNPSYMAPECLSDDEPIATSAADIWSVGVLMFLLMAGYPPFFSDNYNHLLKNISEANYVFPKNLWNHVTDDGQAVLKEILQQDLKERPSAVELLNHRWFKTRISTASKILINISTPTLTSQSSSPLAKTRNYLFNNALTSSITTTAKQSPIIKQDGNHHRHPQNVWVGQKRLKGFLRYLNDKKTRANHREYSLVFKERQAFIPDDIMISVPQCTPGMDFYQQKVLDKNKIINLSDSIEKLELQRQSLHW